MDDKSFGRAQKFLDYHPAAKWLAILCSAGTALLYVALLAILGLFIDLVVSRGEIPPFYDLPGVERAAFYQRLTLPEETEERQPLLDRVRADLKQLGLEESLVRHWFAGEPIEKVPQSERLILWYAELPGLLESAVGDNAADAVRQYLRDMIQSRGVDVAVNQPIPNYGVLSLVARTYSTLGGWFIRALARFADWMWAQGNLYYLQGLFLLGLILAVLRLLLMFLAEYLAAIAALEAVTRLRRAIYHHTNRLGTLAFRALGPSEAVSVSTRHLESVHEGLFLWLTVYFREPIKFCLLLLFALVLNFWLAIAFFLFALLVWIVGGQIAAYYRRQGRVAEMHSAEQLALMQESLMLMRLVKVYLMEQFNQARV